MESTIEITLEQRESYQNPYNENRLAPEFAHYILSQCKGIGRKSTFIIEIDPRFEMRKDEQRRLVDMIRAHFGVEVREIMLHVRRNMLTDALVFAAGILLLSLYVFSSAMPVVSQFILVIGWVLIWEGAHNLIFDSYRIRLDIRRSKRIAACKIRFTQFPRKEEDNGPGH